MSLYVRFVSLIRDLSNLSRDFVRAKVDRNRAETELAHAEAHLLMAELNLKRAGMHAMANQARLELIKATKLLEESIAEIESEGGKVEFDKKKLILLLSQYEALFLSGLTANHKNDA